MTKTAAMMHSDRPQDCFIRSPIAAVTIMMEPITFTIWLAIWNDFIFGTAASCSCWRFLISSFIFGSLTSADPSPMSGASTAPTPLVHRQGMYSTRFAMATIIAATGVLLWRAMGSSGGADDHGRTKITEQACVDKDARQDQKS